MKCKQNFKSVCIPLFFAIILNSVMGCVSLSQTDDPDFLGDFPPQHLGTIHLNIVKRYSNSLLPRNVSFVFEPRSNIVRFHHKFMGDNIWVYLDKKDRAAFRNAIEAYLADFKAHRLTPEGAKKKGAFGTTGAAMTWGLFGSAHAASPALRFEYQFITPQRPYFIIGTATESSEDGYSSPAIRIAVSPVQCKELLTVLDDAVLLELVNSLKSEHEKFDDSEENNPVRDIENSFEESDTPAETTSADTASTGTAQPLQPAQPFDEF
ncbi:MAG: hypothetical protein ACTTH8_05555 [Treponema sp.]